MSKKTKLNYGKEDILSDDSFEPRNVKKRISIMLDLDLLDEFKKRAKASGKKYQTLLNDSLREFLFGSRSKKEIKDLIKETLLDDFSDPESTEVKALRKTLKL